MQSKIGVKRSPASKLIEKKKSKVVSIAPAGITLSRGQRKRLAKKSNVARKKDMCVAMTAQSIKIASGTLGDFDDIRLALPTPGSHPLICPVVLFAKMRVQLTAIIVGKVFNCSNVVAARACMQIRTLHVLSAPEVKRGTGKPTKKKAQRTLIAEVAQMRAVLTHPLFQVVQMLIHTRPVSLPSSTVSLWLLVDLR